MTLQVQGLSVNSARWEAVVPKQECCQIQLKQLRTSFKVTSACSYNLLNLFCRRCQRPGKLPQNSVGTLQSLRQNFTNVVVNFIWQNSLTSLRAISPPETVHESCPFTRLLNVFPYCHYGTSSCHLWQFYHRGNGDVIIGDFVIPSYLHRKWVQYGQFPINRLVENVSYTKHIYPVAV